MSTILKVGDDNFEDEVLKSDRLTLVDFGAEWCGPCKKLHPIVAELAVQYKDRIKVVEVDVAQASAVAMKYGITSVPQLMIVHKGTIRETVVGLLPKSKIQDKIDAYLQRL